MPKNRNIALCIIFAIISCGIYTLYWIVALTDETNQIAGEPDDTSGVTTLILTIVTCGIYGLYWAYKRGEKIDKAHQRRGSFQWRSTLLDSLHIWRHHRVGFDPERGKQICKCVNVKYFSCFSRSGLLTQSLYGIHHFVYRAFLAP